MNLEFNLRFTKLDSRFNISSFMNLKLDSMNCESSFVNLESSFMNLKLDLMNLKLDLMNLESSFCFRISNLS